jgi:hypothetical protein
MLRYQTTERRTATSAKGTHTAVNKLNQQSQQENIHIAFWD